MTSFSKFIIYWIFFLCLLSFWQIVTSLVQAIALYSIVNQGEYRNLSVKVYYLDPMDKIVIPLKDLLLALSFVYLYYHQGMKK